MSQPELTRGTLAPIEDVIAAAERRAEAQWEREHTPCEHENTYQALAGGEYCSDCGWKL